MQSLRYVFSLGNFEIMIVKSVGSKKHSLLGNQRRIFLFGCAMEFSGLHCAVCVRWIELSEFSDIPSMNHAQSSVISFSLAVAIEITQTHVQNTRLRRHTYKQCIHVHICKIT